MSQKVYSMQEVSKHTSSSDCWVVLHGKVYDLTNFLHEHPGGAEIILSKAGKDATAAFEPIHPADILSILPPACELGTVDPASVRPEDKVSDDTPDRDKVFGDKQPPTIDQMINVFDFEDVAKAVMKKEAWDYYSSGCADEITLRENHAAFQRLWFRPRVLVDVSRPVDMSCTIAGCPSKLPLYITATALGKLAHPEGEVVLTRAAATHGIIQMCPTLASCSLEEMTSARQPGQSQFFQLYVNRNRRLTEDLVRKAERLGCKALFITVDAAQIGRREKDMRNKFSSTEASIQRKTQQKINRNAGTAKALGSFIDPALSWKDIAWFKQLTNMPIYLKGIQCGEDAILAVQHGLAGVVLSNHGGRQLDFARSGIEVLPEVMQALRSINAVGKLEVLVDGGVRRGTDIFKALALGATAVGVGRPVLYGMAAFGQEGVEKVLQIFTDELVECMRLMGTPRLADIRPGMVLTRNLDDHVSPVPSDNLSALTYQPMVTQSKL